MFIDFLYSNLRLGAPKGMEDRVAEIPAFRGREFITACYQFSQEELAEINKTGVLWFSMLGQAWPPVKVDAFIPVHRPASQLRIFGEFMVRQDPPSVLTLYYLDLTIFFLRADPDHTNFIWKEIPVETPEDLAKWEATEPFKILDLQYRDRTSPVHSGGRYMFSEALEIVGRFKDLARLQPLAILYPFLQAEEAGDYLVLAPRETPPEPRRRIIGLYQ